MNSIIIHQKESNREEWLEQLATIITTQDALLSFLQLSHLSDLPFQQKNTFPIRVPLAFAKRMEKGNPNDPLLLQVMMSPEEDVITKGYSTDPLEEQDYKQTNLLHKYKNRVLLITKNSCAINCRYCFRRHFPYQDFQGNKQSWQDALDYIAVHPELNEIILSGGDPLMAKDHELKWLMSKIESIPHIKTLRIHTRLAVVIPTRITDALLFLFALSRLNVVLVTHINHANEIDINVMESMQKLKNVSVTLLNQSVLLKNINDNVQTLVDLSLALFDVGILPYYIHLLDKVQGAAHFYVSSQKAKLLMSDLAKEVSGYLLPKLAREISKEKNKTLIHY